MKKVSFVIIILIAGFSVQSQTQTQDLNMGQYQLQFPSISGGNDRIQSYGGSGTYGIWLFKSRFDHIVIDAGENNWNNRQIIFKTGGVEKVRLNSDGNFGIGLTNPASALEVNGDISIGRAHKFKFLEGTGGGDRAHISSTNGEGGDYNSLIFAVGGGIESMIIKAVNGAVGIGTTSTGSHKLAVDGSIGAREIKVEANGWSDFVFEEKYKLPTLIEVENQIKDKGHLKDIPSESEVKANGINLGEMDAKLLQKIEELTLYMIEMNKSMVELKARNEQLEKKVAALDVVK